MNNLGEEQVQAQNLALDGLKQAVEERDRCLEGKNMVVLELMGRVSELEDQVARKENVLKECKRLLHKAHINAPREEGGPQDCEEEVPVLCDDLLHAIFLRCDAHTRIAFAHASARLRSALSRWADVRHLYVRRSDAIEESHVTLVPHSYTALSDVPSVGPLRFYSFDLLRQHCPGLTTLILESSQFPSVSQVNRLHPPDTCFVNYFPNLEVVKFCTIKDNMGLSYTLANLLALKKLTVVHIREDQIALGDIKRSVAPVEDVRISVKYQEGEEFMQFLGAIKKTVRSFVFSVSSHFTRHGTSQLRISGHDFWKMVTSMDAVENVSYPVPLMRVVNLPTIAKYLSQTKVLKSLTLEVLPTSHLAVLAQNLPDSFEGIVVTDTLVIQGTHVKLTSMNARFGDVITPVHQMGLAADCQRVQRPLFVQLGIYRSRQSTVDELRLGQVTLKSNLGSTDRLFFSPHDKRVFFWNGFINSRVQFLKYFNIHMVANTVN